MSIKVYPAVASGIKSVQRGAASSAGNITISSVNTNKSFVTSFSTGSAGTVATNSSESGTLTPSGGSVATQANGAMGGGSFPNLLGQEA